MKKAGRNILRGFLILVIGLTVGLSIYTLNAKKVMHDAMPMPLGFGMSVVLTGSMEPVLEPNDLVFVKATDDFAVGDIAVYQSGMTLIIHRIIDIDEAEGKVLPKGDANNTDDGWIEASALKGKFVFRIPFVGLLIKAIKSLPGVIIIIGLSAFLMIRSRRNEQKEKTDGLHDIREEIEKLKSEMTAGQDENAADSDKPDSDQDGENSQPEARD